MALLLKEKNRRAAAANRLRIVIRCEENAADKEYLALGRYYYNALRDADNPIAESHCARIDQINARRDSALEQLEQLSQEEIASIGFIDGEDGPTAVFSAGKTQSGSIFRFRKGQGEMTVTPEEDEDAEEIDLSDVECFDSDPTLPQPETAPVEAAEVVPEIEEPEALVEEEMCQPVEREVPRSEPETQPAEHETRPAEHKIPQVESKTQPAEHETQPAELDENDALFFE